VCCSVLCSVRFPNSDTAEKVCASVARVLQYALQYELQYVWRCVFCVLQCVVQCAVSERLLNSDTAENTHIHTCTHTLSLTHTRTLSHTQVRQDMAAKRQKAHSLFGHFRETAVGCNAEKDPHNTARI